MEGDSRAAACAALAGGDAVVVANPAPMTYGVVATSARAVNAMKGRPLDQTVALSLHNRLLWHEVEQTLDVPRAVLGPVVALLRRRLTVLLPVLETRPRPAWTTPAIRNGRLAVFNGYWPALGWLWQDFPRLYGSSANRTGEPPVASARDAVTMFGERCVVADAADGVDEGPRWASTMVQIDTAGRIALHRSGAQDRSVELPPGQFIRQLAGSVGLRPSVKAGAAD